MKFNEAIKPFKSVKYFLVVVILISAIMGVTFTSWEKITWTKFFIGMSWSALIFVTQWIGHSTLANLITNRFPWKTYGWKTVILRVITLVVYSIIAYAAVMLVMIRIFYGPITTGYISNIVSEIPIVLGISFFISFLLASIEFYKNWQETTLEKEKLKAEVMTYKYESLKKQINPHFLFNSLNVLSDLVVEDQDLAIKFIRQLSLVYRHVLDSSQKELVPLSEEINLLESYGFLLETRFESGLNISIDLDLDDDVWLVPLSLQLLVENAVKHNVTSPSRPLTITITNKKEYIIVSNNLQEKETGDLSSGKGLNNIISRYDYFTKTPVIINKDSYIFEVKIPILESA